MSIVAKYQKEIAKLEKKIDKVQAECNHPSSVVERKYDANTGHYDPGDDSFWVTFQCNLCHKRWRANYDTNPEEYKSDKGTKVKEFTKL